MDPCSMTSSFNYLYIVDNTFIDFTNSAIWLSRLCYNYYTIAIEDYY